MKRTLSLLAAVFLMASLCITPRIEAATTNNPTDTRLNYGLYIHFGLATFTNPADEGQNPVYVLGIRQPPERFAPSELDPKGWARSAKNAGMTFAVLTAKHMSGFCLWDSKDYDYDIGKSPFKRNIIAEFISACKAEGIVPGVHYSLPDAYNEGEVKAKGPVGQSYFNVIKKHLTELQTNYRDLRIQILDLAERLTPAQLNELTETVRRANPDCAVWPTTGGDQGPHHFGGTVNKNWMWRADDQLIPAVRILDRYQRCQKAGKAFVLNVGPNREGKIPENQIAVLLDLKRRIANTPTTTVSPTTTEQKPEAAERLKKLKQLYEKGLITKDDYDRKVQEIMDTL